MNQNFVPTGITKVDRDEFLTYLDTTPSANTETWAILGVGITDYGISYNPQIDSEKWIIEKNARQTHSSNEKQGSVSQQIYKGDPCFEFVAQGRDKLNYKTHILDIDRWNGTGSGTSAVYPAKKSDGIIGITQWMNEDAVIEYDLYYDGDPVVGTVSFDASGVPTFTPTSGL